MSERNWTAGPWWVEDGMAEEKGYVVAKLDMHSYVMAEHEAVNDSRHDAHLIAAAPELYGSLDEVLRLWIEDADPSECYESVRDARAALAKARGDQP